MNNELIVNIHQSVLNGDIEEAKKYTLEAVNLGIDPLKILEEGGAAAIKIVGQKFANFEIFLPELMTSAEAMKGVMDVIIPILKAKGESNKGTVLIGTASGDIHDIGKNLVAALLSANGFEVIDIGVDVPSNKFVEAIEKEKPDIVAISALMSTSAYYQETIINLMGELGIRDKHFVIVGGGPITPDYARKIGADGYGRTAINAVEVCEKLMVIKKDKKNLEETIICE